MFRWLYHALQVLLVILLACLLREGGGGRDTRGNTAACGNIIVWLLFLVLLCYVLCVRRLAKEAIVECGG